MSYLITIEPGRSEVGIKNNREEIAHDTHNSIYQTQLDLTIRTPKNGAPFPLVIANSDQSSHRDELQASEVMAINGMGASSEHPASTLENREEESDAGVETRSCGKISALISHFKNVQATSSRCENVPHTNVPTKKLRVDFQNVVVDKPSSPTKTLDFTATNKVLETAGQISRGTVSLPAVKLQFKTHTADATQLHQNNTVKNKIIKKQEQFLSRNNITTKPLVKPRSFMNNQTDHNGHQQSENSSKELCNKQPSEVSQFCNKQPSEGSQFCNKQPSDGSQFCNKQPSEGSQICNKQPSEGSQFCNKQPSEGSQLSPIVDDSKSEKCSSDVREVKRLQWRKQRPSNVNALPKLLTSNSGDMALTNLQESNSPNTDQNHCCLVDTVTAHPGINSGEDTVSGSTVNAVVGGSTVNAVVGRSTVNANVGGSTVNANVGGSTVNANVGGSTVNANVGGSTVNANVGGSTVNANVGGSTVNANVGGSTVNAVVSGSTVNAVACGSTFNSNVGGSTFNAEGNNETRTETSSSDNTIYHETDYFPMIENPVGKDDTPIGPEITSVNPSASGDARKPTDAANVVELLKRGNVEESEELVSSEATSTKSAAPEISNDGREPVVMATVTSSSSEPVSRRFVPEIKVSFDGDRDIGLVADRCTDTGSQAVDLVADRCTDTGSQAADLVADKYSETRSHNVGGEQALTSVVDDDRRTSTKYSDVSDRINDKLDLLKSELMAMRKMDLVLLRQLINISQTMQRIQRSDVLRMSRSMSFLSRNRTMPRRCRPVERQNSAPHCADRKRFLFSHLKSNTDDDFRDSLSSFDESEADSAPSEVEESTNSLNSLFAANSPMTATNRQKFFQSHDLLISLDVAEDVEQNYEDILSRNVRLWKMSFQRQQSVQEEINAWF